MALLDTGSRDIPMIALLHDAHARGGMPDAADVLEEAAHIADGLRGLGYETVTIPVSLDLQALVAALEESTPGIVFNLMESIDGHARLIHVVPSLLEALGMPFTGCTARAQWASSNKLEAKRLLAAADIATPEIAGVQGARGRDDGSADTQTWIVKSVWEHASVGLDDESVVAFGAVPDQIARRSAQFGGDWFAEHFIVGRELNVALLADVDGPQVLPVAEIRFEDYPAGKPKIVGYAAKWQPESREYSHTVRSFDVEPELAGKAARIALQCWDLFGLSGYARVDFRVGEDGRIWVLEINANPCLSADAGFAAMLAEARIPFASALQRIVADATTRARRLASAGCSPRTEAECSE